MRKNIIFSTHSPSIRLNKSNSKSNPILFKVHHTNYEDVYLCIFWLTVEANNVEKYFIIHEKNDN